MMTLSDSVGIVEYIKKHYNNISWYIHKICKLPYKLAPVWYDILRDDIKQEWIVLKNDGDIEPIFYFKSTYRPNDFMTTKTSFGAPTRTVILGTGRWNVQIYEWNWQYQKEKKKIC